MLLKATISFLILITLLSFTFKSEQEKTEDLSTDATEIIAEASNLADTSTVVIPDDIPPTPVGGIQAFYQYIGENYVFPEEALGVTIKGKVIVSFVVEKDGSIADVTLVSDLGYGTGEAAVALLKNSPKWNPAYHKGKPVRVQFSLPIRLNRKASKKSKRKSAVKAPSTSDQ